MKQLAVKFLPVEGEYYPVVLACGHTVRFHRSVVQGKHKPRKWYVCSKCGEFERSQGRLNFGLRR